MNANTENKSFFQTHKDYILGSREFYKTLLLIVVPIILQNTLTNVVSLLDNVMVGSIGTLPMTAVAIVNQLFFVFYLANFGGLAGAGIFGAQYYGSRDMDGFRNVFKVKLIMGGVILLIGLSIFMTKGLFLAGIYIAEDTSPEQVTEILALVKTYMYIMLLGMPAFTLTQCYSGSLREAGQTRVPMIASIAAMLVNFVFNLLLIFGLCGFPRMGVAGAAAATVISRFVELLIVCAYSHGLVEGAGDLLHGVYRGFHIPKQLFGDVCIKAFPLMVNEILWASGEAFLLQAYSTRGIDAVAAMNINNTLAQIFNEMFLSIGVGAGIMIGQKLGAEDYDEAVKSAWRLVWTSVFVCGVVGSLLAASSPFIPYVYNTEDHIRSLAAQLLLVSAIVMPLRGLTNAAFFIIRSGGRVLLTFMFDSCFTCVVVVPTALIVANLSTLTIVPMYFLCAGLEMLKCVLAVYFLRSGGWVRNIIT